jgi:hypothetical protein
LTERMLEMFLFWVWRYRRRSDGSRLRQRQL